MREMQVCTRDAKDGEATYRYAILVGEMQVSPRFSCESYGVKISDVTGREVAVVPNITPSISKIDGLITQLVDGGVPPHALKDIVSDWLD